MHQTISRPRPSNIGNPQGVDSPFAVGSDIHDDHNAADALRLACFVALNVAFGWNNNEYTTDFKLYGWLTIANGGLALRPCSARNIIARGRALLHDPGGTTFFFSVCLIQLRTSFPRLQLSITSLQTSPEKESPLNEAGPRCPS